MLSHFEIAGDKRISQHLSGQEHFAARSNFRAWSYPGAALCFVFEGQEFSGEEGDIDGAEGSQNKRN